METNITPQMLRTIADRLNGYPWDDFGHDFICSAAEELFGWCGRESVRVLLRECGLIYLLGGLGLDEAEESGRKSEYTRTAMPIRFMLLEFIALMLEGETP